MQVHGYHTQNSDNRPTGEIAQSDHTDPGSHTPAWPPAEDAQVNFFFKHPPEEIRFYQP